MSDEYLEERVEKLERREEQRQESRTALGFYATLFAGTLVGTYSVVFWHAPIPGPWDEAFAVFGVILTAVAITLYAKDYLAEGDDE